MSNADLRGNRPLSPHLQIYKPMLTMMMSIVHRITGAALYFGTMAFWPGG
jgi:succinate dehydrogenase / fumarate reductase cytochrome b subunit